MIELNEGEFQKRILKQVFRRETEKSKWRENEMDVDVGRKVASLSPLMPYFRRMIEKI